MSGDLTATRPVRVWDAPLRLVHWALALLIPFAWWAYRTDHMAWHALAGFAVIALLVFRLHWGFFGSETARFRNFLRGPRHALRYLRGEGPAPVGHNPLGGWSVAAMLGTLAAQAGLGLFASDLDGLESGPLARYLSFDEARVATRLHGLAFDALLALIGLHIGAVLVYLMRRRNLIGPMLTGRKALPAAIPPPSFARLRSLALGSALAGAAFFALWRLGGL